MKQKERMDKKVKQERTEPDHHRKIIIKGITVYESFRPEGSDPVGLPLAEHGETLKKDFSKNIRYSLIFALQLGRIQTG